MAKIAKHEYAYVKGARCMNPDCRSHKVRKSYGSRKPYVCNKCYKSFEAVEIVPEGGAK